MDIATQTSQSRPLFSRQALTALLSDYGILEIAKTGTIAIERGRSTIYDNSKLREEYDYGKNVL